jgi:hypothetical protein
MAGPLEGLTDEQIIRMVDTNMMIAKSSTSMHRSADCEFFDLSVGPRLLQIAYPGHLGR